MAIEVTATAADVDVDPTSLVATLRRRVAGLVHERDRAADRADQAAEDLAALRAAHRHSLAIRCDAVGCRDSLAVSSAAPPRDGELARGLCVASRFMGWRIGTRTAEAMRALGAGGDAFSSSGIDEDRCPVHRA